MLIDLVANGARGYLFWHASWRARRFNGRQPFQTVTHPNHVHTYFIKYTAAEYATPKPDGNLTRLSPPGVRVWPTRLMELGDGVFTIWTTSMLLGACVHVALGHTLACISCHGGMGSLLGAHWRQCQEDSDLPEDFILYL